MFEAAYIACERLRSSGSTQNSKMETQNNTWVSTPINGYVGSKNSSEILINGKIQLKTYYKFYCDDLDLQKNDIILYSGLNYKVVEVPHNCMGLDDHIKTLLERVS
jgi:hypothetical protein